MYINSMAIPQVAAATVWYQRPRDSEFNIFIGSIAQCASI